MEQRAAFKCWPVLDRRHQGSGTAPIRAVAVDDTGRKLYLGLEGGLLEEYTLVEDAGGCTASLAARKHVSKRVRPWPAPAWDLAVRWRRQKQHSKLLLSMCNMTSPVEGKESSAGMFSNTLPSPVLSTCCSRLWASPTWVPPTAWLCCTTMEACTCWSATR